MNRTIKENINEIAANILLNDNCYGYLANAVLIKGYINFSAQINGCKIDFNNVIWC